MATQITATLPTLAFPKEVDYPTQEDWAAFSAAAELNFGILGGSWSTQMQLWKTEANAMSVELNTNATIAQGLANYQGDWTSKGYTLGQTVSVSGIYYICKLTHATGQNPTVGGSLYWNLAIGNWDLKVNTNMSAYTSKATPVDADLLAVSDSAASFGIKSLSWANIKATLLSYFDTVYSRTTSIFAISQTTQDVTASRTLGTTYTNSTGKPIEISVSCSRNTAGILRISGYRDGITVQISYNELTTTNVQYVHVSFVVPSGSTYKVENVSGATLNSWVELR